MSDFGTHRTQRARKPHQCEECQRTIEPGETYDRYAGTYEDQFFTFVSCAHCDVLRAAIQKVDSWFWEGAFGGVGEWFAQNMIRECQPALTDFATGLRVVRMGRQFNRQWEAPGGDLEPVPAAAA
jgi:hypothetical protein